jgi:hypothetical protein
MANRADGLHDRLNRISHWDVNVTDLERSRSWYEATTTLRVVSRTKASQSFPSFGIESGGVEGYLLKDAKLPPRGADDSLGRVAESDPGRHALSIAGQCRLVPHLPHRRGHRGSAWSGDRAAYAGINRHRSRIVV